jgi:hypothetical protein
MHQDVSPLKMAGTAFLLWTVCFFLYLQSVGFGFVRYDDFSILLAHPLLYNQDSFVSSLYQIFYGYFPREEPLLFRDLSWALDSFLFGFDNPFAYHLGNVLINACNGVLLFVFLLKATRRYPLALVVSLVFILHPLHMEPVCWVMGRKDLLVAFFMLLVLILQSDLLRAKPSARRRQLYLLSLLFYVLAILSKFNAIAFFLVLIVHRLFHEYLNGRKDPSDPLVWRGVTRRVLLPCFPYVLVSVGLFLWYSNILNQYGVLGRRGPSPLSFTHLATLAKFTPLVFGAYMQHLLLPVQYSIAYAWPSVSRSLAPVEIVASVGIAASLVLLFVCLMHRRKDFLCYAVWFVALLLPYLNLVYIGHWQANRYLYLACFCPIVMLVDPIIKWLTTQSAACWVRWLKLPGAVSLVLYLAVLAGWTLFYQRVFKSDHSLWRHEISLSNPSMLAYQAYAKSFVNRARKENNPQDREKWLLKAEMAIGKGVKHFNKLPLVEAPDYLTYEVGYFAKLHYLKGRISELRGESLLAQLAHYKKAYAISPVNSLNQRFLAKTYFMLALFEKEYLLKTRYAALSFGFFQEYVDFIRHRPVKLKKSYRIFQEYLRFFPFLEQQLKAFEENYYR